MGLSQGFRSGHRTGPPYIYFTRSLSDRRDFGNILIWFQVLVNSRVKWTKSTTWAQFGQCKMVTPSVPYPPENLPAKLYGKRPPCFECRFAPISAPVRPWTRSLARNSTANACPVSTKLNAGFDQFQPQFAVTGLT